MKMTREEFHEKYWCHDEHGMIAVNCKTANGAREFLKLANEFGHKWDDETVSLTKHT